MSLYVMAKKHKAKQGVSNGNQFSTYGVRRYHYYTGANRLNQTNKCPQSIGTEALKPVKTTYGLLASRIHFPTQVCEDGTCASYNWVQRFDPDEHSQSEYIHKIKIAAACNDQVIIDEGKGGPCKEPDGPNPSPSPSGGCTETTRIGGKVKSRFNLHKNITNGAMPASRYTNINVHHKNCLPPPPCKAPFPFTINQKGCYISFKTPQEAIDAGFLPKNWMKCDTDPVYAENPYS